MTIGGVIREKWLVIGGFTNSSSWWRAIMRRCSLVGKRKTVQSLTTHSFIHRVIAGTAWALICDHWESDRLLTQFLSDVDFTFRELTHVW